MRRKIKTYCLIGTLIVATFGTVSAFARDTKSTMSNDGCTAETRLNADFNVFDPDSAHAYTERINGTSNKLGVEIWWTKDNNKNWKSAGSDYGYNSVDISYRNRGVEWFASDHFVYNKKGTSYKKQVLKDD